MCAMELGDWDEQLQATYIKPRGEGLDIFIHHFIFTVAVMTLPRERGPMTWYVDRWCYKHLPDAMRAAVEWKDEDPEPPGHWIVKK
jgi:hypothetical protein